MISVLIKDSLYHYLKNIKGDTIVHSDTAVVTKTVYMITVCYLFTFTTYALIVHTFSNFFQNFYCRCYTLII